MSIESIDRILGALNRRMQRIEAASSSNLPPLLTRFRAFLQSDSILGSIVDEALGRHSAEFDGKMAEILRDFPSFRRASMNLSDAQYFVLVWGLVDVLERSGYTELRQHARTLFEEQDEEQVPKFKQHVVGVIYDYIVDRLDERAFVYGQLLRFKTRCECFVREDLNGLVRSGGRQVEKKLQGELYLFLFDQGVEFVIQPYLARGEIDLIADQQGPDPKHIEVKIFDNDRRNKDYIRAGFRQLLTYAKQYGTSIGYLAVFSLCKEGVSFNVDGHIGRDIPFVDHDGIRIIFVVIDLFLHTEPVSQRGPLRTITISKADLIG
jgi:hypothetical protein